MSMKNVVILAGPSAVGKTTVAHKMLEGNPSYEFVRSVTTRAKRGDVFDGEYIYITREQFEEEIRTGGVLEYTEYAGAYYGTPLSEVNRITSEGKIPLLILDMIGVKSVATHKDGINTCGIYIWDELDVMKERLAARYTPDEQHKLTARVAQNDKDYEVFVDYVDSFYSVIKSTGVVENTAKEVESIVSAFLNGVEKNAEENARIAAFLKDSVGK